MGHMVSARWRILPAALCLLAAWSARALEAPPHPGEVHTDDPSAGGGVRPGLEARIDGLLEALPRRPRARDVWDVATALSQLGGDAAALFATKLDKVDEAKRLALANALCLAGRTGEGRRALLELCRAGATLRVGPSREVRIHAVRALGVTEVHAGLEPLARALIMVLEGEPDPLVRTAVADSILRVSRRGKDVSRSGRRGIGVLFEARVRARGELRKIMENEDERACREAALVLGENGEEGLAYVRLMELAREPTDEGRRARLVLKGVRPSWAELLDEVARRIEAGYVDPEKVERSELVNSAARGMARSLDDFSDYLTEDDVKSMTEMLDNHYEGIGAFVGLRDGIFTIISPIYDGPAYRVGLRSLDRILEVEGVRTGDLGFQKSIKRLKGPKGTKVGVKVMRRGWSEPQKFVIVRDEIRVENCYARMLPGRTGYVKLARFTRNAGREVRKHVTELVARGARGLVFDLRDNGGGLLTEAVEVADVFLDRGRGKHGRIVVYSQGRPEVSPMRRFFTSSRDALGGRPLAVLVNSGSASASEIVAGSLQDWGRSRLVGKRTFGKGSVQNIVPLRATERATSLRLTVALYRLPSGRSINKHGVEPDVELDDDPLPGWESEEIIRLKLHEKIGEHVARTYEADPGNRELYGTLAEDDGGRLDSYPGLEAFVARLRDELRRDAGKEAGSLGGKRGGIHVSDDALRRLARVSVRRLVQDERGQQFVCDLQEDRVLRRGVREVLVRLEETEDIADLPPAVRGILREFSGEFDDESAPEPEKAGTAR